MKKDKTITLRINGEIKDIISALGLSGQQILDLWISENIDIETIIKLKENE